jgi:hypothetical protein
MCVANKTRSFFSTLIPVCQGNNGRLSRLIFHTRTHTPFIDYMLLCEDVFFLMCVNFLLACVRVVSASIIMILMRLDMCVCVCACSRKNMNNI